MNYIKHLTFLFCLCLHLEAFASEPVADIHTHYKWSQKGVTTPEEVITALEEQNIDMAVVIGTPAKLALKVEALAPDKIIPIWSPYRIGGDWSRWAFDKETLTRARKALASGDYKGIGELHLISGFAPRSNTDVVSGLLSLAAEYDVPVMIHTEFSRENYMLSLCKQHKNARILWAHAGSILKVSQVRNVLKTCPNVWIGLAARDPWRFVKYPITDEQGKLLPRWEQLILEWPERFMIGSDPVWPVERLDGWDQDDTGWQEYARFINFHRTWLSYLDEDVAEKVRYRNAMKLFTGR